MADRFRWKDNKGEFKTRDIMNLIIISFFCCLRISESADLSKHKAWVDAEGTDLFLNIEMLDTKTSKGAEIQHVTVAECSKDMFCPVAAFMELKLGKNKDLITDSNGNKISADRLSDLFRDFVEHCKERGNFKNKKITWHSLRISAIGFYSAELGAPDWVIQQISRHKSDIVLKGVYKTRAERVNKVINARKIAKAFKQVQIRNRKDKEDSW